MISITSVSIARPIEPIAAESVRPADTGATYSSLLLCLPCEPRLEIATQLPVTQAPLGASCRPSTSQYQLYVDSTATPHNVPSHERSAAVMMSRSFGSRFA